MSLQQDFFQLCNEISPWRINILVDLPETAAMATKDDRRNDSIVFLEMDGGTLNDRQIRKG